MVDADVLKILKLDLQISVNSLDDYLLTIIQAARNFIAKEGITLTDDISDMMLVEMYAAYLYRKRREEKAEMRLFGE